uniref:glycosyltransferase n=1 Tax=Prevotella sp. TaxID=59823 RepID=UPI00402972AC
MDKIIFYINPQSMSNLAEYDYFVTFGIKYRIIYLCSKFYDYHVNPKLKYIPVFKYNHKKSKLSKAISYIISLLHIALLIMIYRPNLVHIQWFKLPTLDYKYWMCIKKIFHIKIIHTAHNILPHNTGKTYQYIYGKIYKKLSDKIIVHTANTKLEICNLFQIEDNKVAVIKHGLLCFKYDEGIYKKLCQESNLSKKIENKIVFTSLGEQSMYKGSDLILDVWLKTPELNQSNKCFLVIAGKFYKIDESEIKKCKNVYIKNERISNEEYIYWVKHSSAYLLPYKTISQSGALLTMLSAHLPVIASNVGGISEPMTIADIGWNIGKANFLNLQKTLLHILHTPEEILRKKKNDSGWNKIEKFYDWNEISKQTEMLYYQM